jgi:hypothetical protein
LIVRRLVTQRLVPEIFLQQIVVGPSKKRSLLRHSSVTNDERALLGRGTDRERPDSGEGLTGLGVFLFVSLPLFIAGARAVWLGLHR